MLPVLLFIFYLVAGIWLVHRFTIKHIHPFSIVQMAAIICFKVSLGCLYGYIFLHYYHGDDTWDIFYQSLGSYERLTHYPGEFLREFNPAHAYAMANRRLPEAIFYYYNHVENWVMVKSFAVLNLISARNYYVDALLFDLLLLMGPLLLFKYVRQLFGGKTWQLMLVVFFIPTLTFWLSGIRADGLLLLITALLIRAVIRLRTHVSGSIICMIGCLLACLLFRIQYAIMLLPALTAYIFSERNPARSWRTFIVVYGSVSLLFFISLWLPATQQGSLPLRQAQAGFFALHGNTRFALDTLKPGVVSFLRVLPQAALNGMLRPFPWEAKGWLQSAIALERTLLLLLFVVLLFRKKAHWSLGGRPLLLFCLFFSVSLLLLEAMVVPFPGALVRYAAIPEWLLCIIALAGFDPLLLSQNPISLNKKLIY